MLSKTTTTVLKQHIGRVNEVEKAIVSAVSSVANVEYRESILFISAYQLYRGVKKGERATITKYLNQIVHELSKSDTLRTRFVRTFNQASDYVESGVQVKLKYLEYTNISKVVTLLRYMRKNLIDDFSKVTTTLSEVYDSDMSPHRYNNAMSDKITELKEEYKLKDQEGEFVFVDVFNMVQSNITKMSNEQLIKLQELIIRNLQEEDVA